MSLFLLSPFQKIDEDLDNWWYAREVYKIVLGTLHALLTNWGVAFPVISISKNRWSSWQLMIYNNRFQSFYWNTSRHIDKLRCRFFLSSPFQKIDEDPDKWWQTTIVSYTKLFLKHFMPYRQIKVSLFPVISISKTRRRSWQMMINNNRIVYKAVAETLHAFSTNWVVAFPVISISINPWWSLQLMIYNNLI